LLAINFRLAPAVSSSSLPATNSDALTGHQLNETLRPFDLWKQVQKASKFVDFTRAGALLEFSEAMMRFVAREERIAATELAFLLRKIGIYPLIGEEFNRWKWGLDD
jgi:hypothetical protein